MKSISCEYIENIIDEKNLILFESFKDIFLNFYKQSNDTFEIKRKILEAIKK